MSLIFKYLPPVAVILCLESILTVKKPGRIWNPLCFFYDPHFKRKVFLVTSSSGSNYL